MRVVHRCCCGIDVHKKTVVVNLVRHGVAGREDLDEVRTYATMTRDLLGLSEWLQEAGCTHVAMESTGVYWKPIHHILEGDFEVLLVNAKEFKNAPGRKSDVRDCQWLAQLLQHGLLHGSFIPPVEIRELRDLTRGRRQLVGERTAVVNRVHKVLQDANIKLSSVASDIMGVSGRAMLDAIIDGESDPVKLAGMARGRLQAKQPLLEQALHGRISAHHRFLLAQYRRQIEFLNEQIAVFEQRIDEQVSPFFDDVRRLATIPGINETAAKAIIAEIGVDMTQFPDQHHLASWAGLSPGTNQSAGRIKSSATTNGNHWLRAALGEAAWAASRTKGTYLAARYRRLVVRRGKKRTIVAVSRQILTIAYFLIKRQEDYRELGEDHYEQQRTMHLTNYHAKRLERLGFKVELTLKQAA